MLLCGCVIVALKDELGKIFSPDEKVSTLVSSDMCIVLSVFWRVGRAGGLRYTLDGRT